MEMITKGRSCGSDMAHPLCCWVLFSSCVLSLFSCSFIAVWDIEVVDGQFSCVTKLWRVMNDGSHGRFHLRYFDGERKIRLVHMPIRSQKRGLGSFDCCRNRLEDGPRDLWYIMKGIFDPNHSSVADAWTRRSKLTVKRHSVPLVNNACELSVFLTWLHRHRELADGWVVAYWSHFRLNCDYNKKQ